MYYHISDNAPEGERKSYYSQIDLVENNIMKELFTINMSLLTELTADGQAPKDWHQW